MTAFVPASGRGLPACTGLRRSNAGVCLRKAPAPTNGRVVVPTAKMFGWKDRQNPDYGKVGGDGVFTLNNIRPAPGSTQKKKRKGRGHAAGQGGSCGFGMRGQKSRSGRGTRPGFEGGQTPLYRKLPKFVGRPMGPGHKKTEYALIKISHLNSVPDEADVDMELLQKAGITTKQKKKFLFKVVGDKEAELTAKNITVRAHAFTESAADAIQNNGGTCILISPTTGKDLVFDEDDDDEDDEVTGEEEEDAVEDTTA